MSENDARVRLNYPLLIFLLRICTSFGSSLFPGTSCQCEEFAIDGKPFVAVWNSPTGGCTKNFSVEINLKDNGILENENQTWDGKYVTVFYNAQLGQYPYFTDSQGTGSYNGGMPQLVDLDAHLEKSKRDIIDKIPDPQYNGLAVIDWEGWRPVWHRNWDSKKLYQTKSIEIARSQYPDWPLDKLVELAKSQFEDSSRRLMEATIRLGRTLRPHGKWGFYGFPDCYGRKDNGYKCSEKQMRMNDELVWMYDLSTAFYPSIYLQKPGPSNSAFVRGRMMETIRLGLVQAMKRGSPVPIFPYFRFIYEKDFLKYNFLKDEDLRNTIGQVADLGAAGVVMWGNRRDENTSPQVCKHINHYIHSKLGPFIHRMKTTAEKCSELKCRGNGRCIKGVTSVGMDVNKNNMIRRSCPFKAKTFTPKKNIDKEKNAVQILNDIAANVDNRDDKMLSAISKLIGKKDLFFKNSKKDYGVAKDVSEVLERGLGRHDNQRSSQNHSSTAPIDDQPTEMVYCNKTAVGETKCVLVNRHTAAQLSKHGHFHMPKIYAVLISISLGGALVLSTVYIGTYWYFNIYKKQRR